MQLEVTFLLGIGLIWIIFASVTDLKKREVPNWLSFSLIIFALGFRLFYGIFESWNFFLQGIIGLGIFFVLGNLFYYLKLFAGGDAKLMIALGSVLPFFDSFSSNLKVYGSFIFLFFLAGAVYGLILTLGLSLRNFKSFKRDFAKRFKKNSKVFLIGVFFGILLIILGFFENIFFSFGILILIFPFLYFYAKSVDSVCMVKKVKVEDLREGDWLVSAIKVGRKIIKPTWAGLSKRDIGEIRKRYKVIKIKQGIPFVPVFLIAFVILMYVLQQGLWNMFW